MKLNSPSGMSPVLETHNFIRFGPGDFFQAGGKRFFFHQERVVARGREGIGNLPENSFSGVKNLGNFSVHDALCPDHFPAKHVTDALMTQANAQDRDFTAEGMNDLVGYPRFFGGAGSGRDDNPAGLHLFYPCGGNLVITVHHRVRPQLAQILDEVVRKGVVIIDD